jgi:hypothetical protein
MIHVPKSELEMLADICYNLTKNGAAYIVFLRGQYWEIEITGY